MVQKIVIFFVINLTFAIAAQALSLTNSQLEALKPLDSEQKVSAAASEKEKILYFWATWCPDCKSKLGSEFKNASLYEKFDVYLVATDKDAEKIKHFQKKNEIPPYVAIDDSKSLQKALSVFSVPTFLRLKKEKDQWVVVAQRSGGAIEDLLK